eukprot:scaffold24272_cov94-Isochrysis_galbana.AAC.1
MAPGGEARRAQLAQKPAGDSRIISSMPPRTTCVGLGGRSCHGEASERLGRVPAAPSRGWMEG